MNYPSQEQCTHTHLSLRSRAGNAIDHSLSQVVWRLRDDKTVPRTAETIAVELDDGDQLTIARGTPIEREPTNPRTYRVGDAVIGLCMSEPFVERAAADDAE